jgi:hypothetical protein
MIGTDDFLKRLKEIEALIQRHANPDGSFDFDPVKVMTGLELASRMIEEKTDDD